MSIHMHMFEYCIWFANFALCCDFRCVIAELFLEGMPLFELSQLLAYRRGQYDPTQHLEKVVFHGIMSFLMAEPEVLWPLFL